MRLDRLVQPVQVIVDVAEVLAACRCTRCGTRPPLELAQASSSGVDGVLERSSACCFNAYSASMFARGEVAAKICSSMRSSSVLERVEHREIAVDDGVHQRVEHEARARAAAARARARQRARTSLEALLGAAAHREHVVAADEDVDLADVQLVGRASSIVCSTTNSESPYSSIFGRWWPWRASSTASSCRSNSSCICSSVLRRRARAAPPRRSSPGAPDTRWISFGSMSASLRPFW